MIIKKAQLRRLDEIYRSMLVTKVMGQLQEDLKRTMPSVPEQEQRKAVMDALAEADGLNILLDNERAAYAMLKLYRLSDDIKEADFMNMIKDIKHDSACALTHELSVRISLNNL